jgi:hypothetical protein
LAINNGENILLEKNEHFEKQTYRNRYHLLGSDKVQVLTVPIIKANSKQLISDTKIDHTQPWLRQHLRTWEACYAKSPFYEFYIEDFKAILSQKHELLTDLNLEILSKCLKFLGISKELNYTNSYIKHYLTDTYDLRSVIHPKKNPQDSKFACPFVYKQNFGNSFVPELSVLDLIFNQGPMAAKLLAKAI